MDKFSKGTGIVCEYNPFHKGHAYQISKVKEMGAQFVVCAMSGAFVQRGEPAFQDKYERAENAVKNGADIVLEIPFPFSSMGAEGFARSGVSVLENSGLCTSFAFGSECADVQRLEKTAGVLDAQFHKSIIEYQKTHKELSYAAVRELFVEQKLGREYADILTNPNDILGVEYIKAKKSMVPIVIKRETPRGGYDENFASSSYIRQNLFCGDTATATGGMPDNCSMESVVKNQGVFYKHLVLSLMQKYPTELSDIAEVQNGCEYAIVENAAKARDYEELCELLSSKTLTRAKIRRMLLFSFYSVKKQTLKTLPLYTQVLASSELGNKMLKKYKEDRKIIVASKVADIKKDEQAFEQYLFSRRASEVFEKCIKTLA